ncbi:MAG TPA: Trm112 family protein [Acidimicrobiia bacterium]
MEILVCPVDHADLREDVPASRLVCTDCGRRYPVEDGIPVMLVEEAEMPGQPATKGESNKEPSEDDSDVV